MISKEKAIDHIKEEIEFYKNVIKEIGGCKQMEGMISAYKHTLVLLGKLHE